MRLGANGVAFTLAVMSPTVTREADRLPTGELVDDGGASIELLEQLAEQRDAVGATPFVSGSEAAEKAWRPTQVQRNWYSLLGSSCEQRKRSAGPA
jgi:hypothetical protein